MIMMEEMIITYYCIATLIVIAYLLGSIPSAVWIGKKYYGVDIREHGSKNAGTTNMLRVLGKRAALPVFGLDFLKGFVAVTILDLMKYDSFFEGGANEFWFYVLRIAAVLAAVLGHIFPIFAGFRGGKGVAGGRHHGHQRPAGPALLRRLDPGADGDALRVALVDGGRMLLPPLHAHIAESDDGAACLAPLRHLLVPDRPAAALYPSQEHRAPARRHGVEDLHLAAAQTQAITSGRRPFSTRPRRRQSPH